MAKRPEKSQNDAGKTADKLREKSTTKQAHEETPEEAALRRAQNCADMAKNAGEFLVSAEQCALASSTQAPKEFPLTRNEESEFADKSGAGARELNDQEARWFSEIGKWNDRFENLKREDPNELRPAVHRQMYLELARLEDKLPLLKVDSRVNRGVMAKMPIPSLELIRLENRGKVIDVVKTMVPPTLKNMGLDEVACGLADALIKEFSNVVDVIRALKDNPSLVGDAFIDATKMIIKHPLDTGKMAYNAAVDKTENLLTETADSEGSNLSYEAGYGVGIALTFLIPMKIAKGAKIAGEASKAARVAQEATAIFLRGYAVGKASSKLPSMQDLGAAMRNKEVYGAIVEKMASQYPSLSVLSIRALTQKIAERVEDTDRGEQALLAKNVFEKFIDGETDQIPNDLAVRALFFGALYSLPKPHQRELFEQMDSLKKLKDTLEFKNKLFQKPSFLSGSETAVSKNDDVPDKKEVFALLGIKA